jgi:hypothetical protein
MDIKVDQLAAKIAALTRLARRANRPAVLRLVTERGRIILGCFSSL